MGEELAQEAQDIWESLGKIVVCLRRLNERVVLLEDKVLQLSLIVKKLEGVE